MSAKSQAGIGSVSSPSSRRKNKDAPTEESSTKARETKEDDTKHSGGADIDTNHTDKKDENGSQDLKESKRKRRHEGIFSAIIQYSLQSERNQILHR